MSREHRQSRCQTPRFPVCTQGKPPPTVIAPAFKHCASQFHRYYTSPKPAPYLWERACPEHRQSRCQTPRFPGCTQGKPPPAVIALAFKHCASQFHRYYISPEPALYLWERACPANTGKAGARNRFPGCTQGKPPPAVIAPAFKHCASQSHRYYISPKPALYLWERACPANTGKAGARHRVSPVCPQGKPPPGSQISTWVPSSITRFSGRLKKRRLPLAFFSKNANRLPRQRDMPSRREAMTVSRLRK